MLTLDRQPAILHFVDMKMVQECTNDGWGTAIQVSSNTDSNRVYRVIVESPFNETREAICSCEGWRFRGKCSHQRIAVASLCRWSEITGPEIQTKQQREQLTCPRCRGETEWRVDADA